MEVVLLTTIILSAMLNWYLVNSLKAPIVNVTVPEPVVNVTVEALEPTILEPVIGEPVGIDYDRLEAMVDKIVASRPTVIPSYPIPMPQYPVPQYPSGPVWMGDNGTNSNEIEVNGVPGKQFPAK